MLMFYFRFNPREEGVRKEVNEKEKRMGGNIKWSFP